MNRIARVGYRSDAGFTMLELVVALCVLAIAATFAAPRWAGARDAATLRAATVALAAALDETRVAARRSARRHVLRLDPESGRYASSASAKEHELPASISVEIRAEDGLGWSDPRLSLTFAADGSAQPARIVLAMKGRSAAIHVDGLTGHIATSFDDGSR